MAERLNALAGESSPYLLQHARNPVDWAPWGPEALARSRAENKPIFLSIGYAACHWCHVMEHESFEDDDVAAVLNAHFVPIKVDREERPDLDEIYMTATMLYTGGHGGWPMSVFLAPDLRPIYAGTYFPKHNAYGRPGFLTLLRALAERWRDDPASLTADADKVVALIRQNHVSDGEGAAPDDAQLAAAAASVHRAFDRTRGGLPSGSNKFPPAQALDLLLRRWRREGRAEYLRTAELTLDRMGRGGIYDHLGGGICRYSTDPDWLVPHFEKMLYDQALVAAIYADAAQATDDPALREFFRERARGICDYVLRDLASPEGGFYSSEDADSEGLEGKFYVWTRAQIEDLLGPAAAKLFCAAYDVTGAGNWHHPGDDHVPAGPKNVLQLVRPAAELARAENLPVEAVEQSLAASRAVLFAAREKRVRPGLDDKILTGWNGLMLTALARAAAVLDEPRYLGAAERCADFLLDRLVADGRLLATYGKGRAKLTAYSTDYAFLIEGLIEIYQASGEFARLDQAERLLDAAVARYWDAVGGGFFFTAADAERLLVRSKTVQDGATPSANSAMLGNLAKLAVLLDRADYRDKAERILRLFGPGALARPFQAERLLAYAEGVVHGFDEAVVVGDPADPATRALLAELYRAYRPNKLVARLDPAAAAPDKPLFAGRTLVQGRPAAYVCRNFVCQRPATSADELAAQLGQPVPSPQSERGEHGPT